MDMIFSENRLPLFRIISKDHRLEPPKVRNVSAPAPETTASKGAASVVGTRRICVIWRCLQSRFAIPAGGIMCRPGAVEWRAVAGGMSKLRHLGRLPLLLLAWTLFGFTTAVVAQGQGAAEDRASSRSPADVCLRFAGGLSLGAPLALTKAKLRPGGTLRIVAFGSSSTTGFGAFGKGTAFPDVMKNELFAGYIPTSRSSSSTAAASWKTLATTSRASMTMCCATSPIC